MNVLMISGDPTILVEGSVAHARLMIQKKEVEVLDVLIVPAEHTFVGAYRVACSGSYDVVTAQDPFWRGLLAWLIARTIHAKLNLQVHTDLRHEKWWRRGMARFMFARADSIRVVSEGAKKLLDSWHLKARITVLPIFIDRAPAAALAHRPHARFPHTILWIGRFEEEKNPMEALRILETVRAAGVDAGLILLGAGSLEEKLRARAKSFGDRVEFPGWRSAWPFLEMADVVVSTSRFESYGASIIEALSAGVPVVSPPVGIAQEAGAFVVPYEELAHKALEVLRAPPTRATLTLSLLTKEEWAKQWREALV